MKVINADIFENTEGLIIHGTNCSGGFGSGVAGQIRQRYPEVYEKFKTVPHGEATLGRLQIIDVTESLSIGNAFTQLNYGYDGQKYASPKAIEKALHRAFLWCELVGRSLLAPKIGCGLGGLDWSSDVEPIFDKFAEEFPEVTVQIYEFNK
jgi:O-acetyl-ADP-ribose deacetylase (regulator of RNase III)